MKLVSDLMTTGLLTHQPQDNLAQAEHTMAEHQIRHVPIVNEANQLMGLLSQKGFLKQAFQITDKFGSHHLGDYLAKIPISDCMEVEVSTLAPTASLQQAAGVLLENRRQGCVLVIDEDRHLVGLLTSQDFVRLSQHVLES